MFGQNDQILNIDYSIAPGHRADIARRLICAPVVNYDAHVCGVDDSVAVEIDDRINRYMPQVPRAGIVSEVAEVQCPAISRDAWILLTARSVDGRPEINRLAPRIIDCCSPGHPQIARSHSAFRPNGLKEEHQPVG